MNLSPRIRRLMAEYGMTHESDEENPLLKARGFLDRHADRPPLRLSSTADSGPSDEENPLLKARGFHQTTPKKGLHP